MSNVTDPNGTFFAEGGRPWYGPDFIRNYGFHFVWHADRSTSGNTQFTSSGRVASSNSRRTCWGSESR